MPKNPGDYYWDACYAAFEAERRLSNKLAKALKPIVTEAHRAGSKDIKLVAARMALDAHAKSRKESRP